MNMKMKAFLAKPIIHDAVVSVKTVLFFIFAGLVALGICYISNYRISIVPNVNIVSPVVTSPGK